MTYVIARNGSYEGYSPPLLCISDLKTALVALKFIKSVDAGSFELFEVPDWPKAPTKWWDTNAMPPHQCQPGSK
jgi:hypothetical protein